MRNLSGQRRTKGSGCVRERGAGIWEIRYPLSNDPATGKRRVATATVRGSRKDAEKALRGYLAAIDSGEHVDPSRTTVSDFIDRWLKDWASVNVGAKTLERYGELLRLHVVPHIGKRPIQKLRPADLSELYRLLLQETGLAPRTVGHVHRVLHRALGQAMKWNNVLTNVADQADPPRVESTEIEILSEAEVGKVLKELRGRSLHPIVFTALGTGMRRGELVALRWQDVDLDRAVIRVERSVEQTKLGLRFKSPKTKHGRRNIALPQILVTELRAHWKEQQEARLRLGAGKSPPDALVFATFDGQTRSPNALTKEWTVAARALGIGVTFHALRHTHASQLIASGLDVLTISRRLGHASPTITLSVYGHLFANTDERAAQAFDAAFSSVGTD